MSIDPRERQRILEIAREVRRHVRRESGAYCSPEGLCGEASIALSSRLVRAKIPHELWIGMWKGPITVRGQALTAEEEEAEWSDPLHVSYGEHRAHTWVVFPQHNDSILDVTADQFHKVPAIWFPAKKEWFERLEKYEIDEIYKEARRLEGQRPKRLPGFVSPLIPLSGPRFRRPPRPVQVREHRRRQHG